MRPDYTDLKAGDFSPEAMAPWDFVELKLDGLYAEFVGDANGWSIHGRNGALLRWGDEPCPDCYLRGEMIDGTEWAKGSELYGSFVAWDCIYFENTAIGGYRHSREHIYGLADNRLPAACKFAPSGPQKVTEAASEMWADHPDWEGLVFRSADGKRFGRMKRVATQDYVCTGVRRQGPRVTALFGGLWIDGHLETVCTVPVKAAAAQAAIMGRHRSHPIGQPVGLVFEAAGNRVLKSGSLRHPRQATADGSVKWRPDKAPGECRL